MAFVDYIVVACYFFLTLYIGIRIARTVKNEKQYATGNYSALVIFATTSASFIGGGFTIGLAQKTYLYGLIYVIAMWGFSFKEILVAKFIAPKLEKFRHCMTVGHIIREGYGKNAQIFTGICSVIVCGGIIGAQFHACGSICSMFFGISPIIGTLITALVVLSYTAWGGIRSVVAVDILHLCFFFVALPLLMIFGMIKLGSADAVLSSPHTFAHSLPISTIVILFASFFLGETLIPPYVQRLLIGEKPESAARGTFWSGVVSLLFFTIIGVVGVVAWLQSSQVDPNLALPFVIQTSMPIGLKGLAVAAMFAVIMSSSNSFLNATSLSMYHDVMSPIHKGTMNLWIQRLTTVIIGLIALIFSMSVPSALDILLYSYQFWTPFILVPLVVFIYGVKVHKNVFFVSVIFSGVGTILWNMFIPSQIDGGLEGVIFGTGLSLLVFFFGILMTGKKRKIRS